MFDGASEHASSLAVTPVVTLRYTVDFSRLSPYEISKRFAIFLHCLIVVPHYSTSESCFSATTELACFGAESFDALSPYSEIHRGSRTSARLGLNLGPASIDGVRKAALIRPIAKSSPLQG
jgi:hypothetical protein